MTLRTLLLDCALVSVMVGCGLSEGEFVAGADYEPCDSIFYVCSSHAAAGCVLGESKYTDGSFPGERSFVVSTVADTTVIVKIFFKTRIHPGEDMSISWYETGCSDLYTYEKGLTEDIFAMAGGDQVFLQEHKVRQAGDHLVEIFCDATADYLLRVELDTPIN